MILAHGLNKMTEYKKIFKCLTENDTKKLACCFSNVAQKGTFLRYTARLAQEKALFRAFLFRI